MGNGKLNGDIFVSFQTEYIEWIISTFASFGHEAEIVSPDTLHDEMNLFLKQAQKIKFSGKMKQPPFSIKKIDCGGCINYTLF